MKQIVKLLLLTLATTNIAFAQPTTRIVCDETCKTELGATAVKGDGYAVVSPVGRGTLK